MRGKQRLADVTAVGLRAWISLWDLCFMCSVPKVLLFQVQCAKSSFVSSAVCQNIFCCKCSVPVVLGCTVAVEYRQ